ncbi:MAG TPA: metallophosphoesterase, partial [Myxococcales bacterium]|nr:metallophosphoesterase [Myxococcales bacterium]
MKLWAISDLHVSHADHRWVVSRIAPHPEDWLILGGDVGETLEQLRFVLETLTPRFARLLWVPGNHDLWVRPENPRGGDARYRDLVALCRRYGTLTPEDPFPVFE